MEFAPESAYARVPCPRGAATAAAAAAATARAPKNAFTRDSIVKEREKENERGKRGISAYAQGWQDGRINCPLALVINALGTWRVINYYWQAKLSRFASHAIRSRHCARICMYICQTEICTFRIPIVQYFESS